MFSSSVARLHNFAKTRPKLDKKGHLVFFSLFLSLLLFLCLYLSLAMLGDKMYSSQKVVLNDLLFCFIIISHGAATGNVGPCGFFFSASRKMSVHSRNLRITLNNLNGFHITSRSLSNFSHRSIHVCLGCNKLPRSLLQICGAQQPLLVDRRKSYLYC